MKREQKKKVVKYDIVGCETLENPSFRKVRKVDECTIITPGIDRRKKFMAKNNMNGSFFLPSTFMPKIKKILNINSVDRPIRMKVDNIIPFLC